MAAIHLPVDSLDHLRNRWDKTPQKVREALAAELYRTQQLSETQLMRLLDMKSRFEVHALLKELGVPYQYSIAEVESDLAAHRDLGILPPE